MISFVGVDIEFESASNKRFRVFSGAHVRAFVYWILRRKNPVFAEKLHSSKELAPFSVTPIMDGGSVVNAMERGKAYSFSVTFFIPEIGEAFKDFLKRASGVFLAGCEHPLKRAAVRYYGVEDLAGEPVEKFRLRFVTPCYFRRPSRGYRFIPMPVPELMFRSLARLYEAFVSEIGQEYREWLDEGGIAVSGFSGRTEKVTLKGGMWTVGFVGTVNFSLPEDVYSEEFAKITSMLLRFGEHTNVGGGRTSGLGMFRVENIENLQPNR